MNSFDLIIRKIVLLSVTTVAALNCCCQVATAPIPYTVGILLNYVRTWDAAAPQTNSATLVTGSLREVNKVLFT